MVYRLVQRRHVLDGEEQRKSGGLIVGTRCGLRRVARHQERYGGPPL
jgi:hypothetical protein